MLIRFTILCLSLILVLFGTVNSHAQGAALHTLSLSQKQEARVLAQMKMRMETVDQRTAWLKKHSARRPQKRILQANLESASEQLQVRTAPSAASQMPEKSSIPGEFEESQAVFLSWPYYAFNVDGDHLDPLTKEFGYHYLNDSGDYAIEQIAGYELDTVAEYSLANKWAELADAIQQELPVWLVVYNPDDTTALLNFMQNRGTPLKNYRFFCVGGGNSFWIRDFGPIGFYYGDQDSIGFIDPIYYTGRAADDSVPGALAEQLGYKLVRTQLKFEGGNFMCDGNGIGFTSSMVDSINADPYVQASVKYDSVKKEFTDVYPRRSAWSVKKTLDTLKTVFGPKQMIVMPTLVDDGGTGHIDMFTKLFDEETIVSTEYPEVFNNKNFRDYNIAKKCIAIERATKSVYGQNFSVLTMPVPTSDNGEYDSTTSRTFGADPRGFLNGLTINKTFIFPSFSSQGSGNEALLERVLELYREYIPGYKLVPIDSRILTPMAGALHCITMQVPVENPLRIHHKAWRGAVGARSTYAVEAQITNRSGIRNASIQWRKKGETSWNTIPLKNDSASFFSSAIPAKSGADRETIEYYLDANSVNGKHATWPITAPAGFYSFTYGTTVSVDEDLRVSGSSLVFPNPAQDWLSVPIDLYSNATVSLCVFDVNGRLMSCQKEIALAAGLNVSQISLQQLAPGVYSLHIIVNGRLADVRRIVKN